MINIPLDVNLLREKPFHQESRMYYALTIFCVLTRPIIILSFVVKTTVVTHNFANSNQSQINNSIKFCNRPYIPTSIWEKRNDGEDEKNIDSISSSFFVEDTSLLLFDLFSILLSSELIGLIDVLNDPNFFQSGGFSQSIFASFGPDAPSTLGILVQRVSILSISWVLSSIKNKRYTSSNVSYDNEKQNIRYLLITLIDYCLLRIFLGIILAYTLHTGINGVDILREIWFTSLTAIGFQKINKLINR